MTKLNLEKDIGHKVRILHNAIGKFFGTCWSKSETEPTRMQCGTMHYLRDHEGEDVFQKDLEETFSISGATATNILKLMEKDGLITRVPMPHDARLKKIELTEKGIAIDDAARANVERLESAIKRGFTEEELTTFRDYLNRVTQNVVDLVEENTK